MAFFRKVRQVAEQIEGLEFGDLHISEITLAELTYGAYRSARPEYHLGLIADFSSGVNVIPISPSLDLFAAEKARLQLEGRPVDNFDLLIGTMAGEYSRKCVNSLFQWSSIAVDIEAFGEVVPQCA